MPDLAPASRSILHLLVIGYLLQTVSCAYYGGDYYNSLFRPLSAEFKNKVETLGAVLKRHVQRLRATENGQVELVFLVDSSSSVGAENFFEELRFVRKVLADFTVDVNKTRVSVITFSSRGKVIRQVDHLSFPSEDKHKCRLLGDELPRVNYIGGGTYTLGAFLEAKVVLKASRSDATKAIFLITDGFSNGGDPRPEARTLRDNGVKIFTFGIRNGNFRELYDMASHPKNETCYILDSFKEFEALARRALHEDLHKGSYVDQPKNRCNSLCKEGRGCCHSNAICTCGTHTGKYECQCKPGYYGQGIGKYGCMPCPPGTYKNETGSGDVSACLPCPDENQTTGSGTASLGECSCKKGFVNMNTSECAAFTCPALEPPEHAYFVNKRCNNVYNAACGIRCKPGYELQGSSLRICQENGIWSGTDNKCTTKTCPPLPTPKDGQMICSRDDFTYSTVCRFTCDTGYKLVGSRKRTCLAIAIWTGLTTRCKEITCQPLTALKDGSVQPAVCTTGQVPFGTTCQMTCLPGYTMYGPHTMQCTPDGNWAPAMEKYNQCLDEKAPFLECPGDVEAEADEDDDSAEVTWLVPVSLDNSGFLPTMTVEPAVTPPARLPIGVNRITYIVEDFSKNVAKCSFTITVSDTTPPTVDRCVSPKAVVSSDKMGNVTWEEPLFSDNSGEVLNVSMSHEQGWFPLGTTQITYTATDSSDNNNTCVLEINVLPHPCEFPTPPVNGKRTCEEREDAVHCNMTCQPGYAFAISPADDYYCAYDNVWEPRDKIPFPDCSEKKISNDVVQPATVKFTGKVPCREENILHKIERNFEKKVSLRVADLCEDDFICSVDDIETTCEEGQDFNKIHIGLGERRRRRRSSRGYRKRVSDTARVGSSLLTFSFLLEATGNHAVDDKSQEAMADNLRTILKTLKQDAQEGHFNFNFSGKEMSFANMAFDPNSPNFMCEEGTLRIGSTCVNCPVGTFFNVIRKLCESCPVGTYQPHEGAVSCLVCPGNMSTTLPNTRTSSQCKAQCLPGTFSENGLERCETCHVGYYQVAYAQASCESCPVNTTTRRRGSRGISSCKEPCPAGYVSKTGLRPCLPCPKGTFQQEQGQSTCFQCPQRALTSRSAATSVRDCEGDWELQSDGTDQADQAQILVNACFDEPCTNGGTCEPKGFLFKCLCPEGFTGLVCQTPVNQCEARPCLNNGVCVNLQFDYVCKCTPGFGGKKCEINENDCASNSCQNGGTCIDGANNFTCNCASGYQGALCEENINDCSGAPCHHGGTCVDDVSGFSCTCKPGFTGETCEIDIDECEDNPCVHGTCTDMENGFSCECPAGFDGKRCQRDVNECESSPCQNKATCEDKVNGYTCRCNAEFTGTNCESPLDKNYQLDFPSAGSDHVQIPIEQDLSVVTVSFWMKTTDTVNQGTPFSYAVEGSDNCLTLTDYDGFAFSVNNEKVITDEPTNDGSWHHVVVTWTANRGSWKLYIDGLLIDSGFDLSTGKPVPGGGIFVIGQEQDSVGGGFDPREAFIGSIAHLNVWDRELPLDTIDHMRTECSEEYGNILAWPDVRSGIKGALQDASSTFCGECPKPMQPDYGEVEYTETSPGSWVEYRCNRGFQLAGWDRLQCLATGEYDNETPTCQKVSCGYPGSIRNGHTEGFNYNYDNRVRYVCSRGFKLVGPKTRYCNEYGEWEGDQPQCVQIACELPPISENTRVKNPQNVYRPGARVLFDCTPGNRLLTPHDAVRCQGDGTWDKSVPSCDPLYCGPPPDVENGGPLDTPEQSFVGVIIQYECDYGYQFAEGSPSTISCQQAGSWDTNLPVCEIILCPDPPIVAHATAVGDEYTFLSLVEYVCDEGYEHIGDDAVECLEDGAWSESPTCDPVTCNDPDDIANGVITGQIYTYNNAINYECNIGYKLKGEKRRQCLANATWSGPEPICKPLLCPKPQALENGRIIAPSISFGSVARFDCEVGYEVDGATEMLCQEDGTWSVSPPTCQPVDCIPPGDIENGYFEISGRNSFGQTVTYLCNSGYEIKGESTLTCESSGRWSADIPSCRTIECPLPPDIQHGSVNALGLTYTSKVEYSCDAGFELQGEAVRTCQADKTWTGVAPTCNSLKCSPPEKVENGILSYKDLSVGDIVRYSCKPGFVREGLEVRRCRNDLTWSGEQPTCNRALCPGLTGIPYGMLNTTERHFGIVVSYSCISGYMIKGDALRTCSELQVWTGTTPVCEPVECDKPATVTSNGRMRGANFTFGAVISYECDEGYNLVGQQNRTCQANRQWDVPIPICEVVECPRAKIRNGHISSFKREYGSEIEFTCKRGYRLEGSTHSICQSSGQWSGESPVCVRVVCPPPTPIAGGTATVSRDGRTLTYTCNKGFRLDGPSERTCQNDGSWSLIEPSCVTISCGIISEELFTNGKITYSSRTFGSYSNFECNTGYQLVGSRRRQCELSGEWSGEIPLCEIISCGAPGAFVNGVINGSVFTFGSSIYYSCNRGYELIGTEKRTCEADGLWVPSTPRCHSIVCPQVPDINHGRALLQSNTVDGTVRYMCQPGYVLRGELTRTCLESAEWSGEAPRCVMLECADPPPIQHGRIEGNSYGLGRTIQYICNEGYELKGSAIIQCLPILMWSGPSPLCEKVQCPQPIAPSNGIVNGDVFTYDEIVTYACMDGYDLHGESIASCDADGTWSSDTPRCEPILCDDPPVLPHMTINLENGTFFRSTIMLTCEVGYQGVGDGSIQCQSDGSWSSSSFFCRIIACPEPPRANNVLVSGNLTYGSELTFTCNVGYELESETAVCRCMANGSWNAPFPTCRITSCPQPEALDHGSISGTDYTYNSQISYTCDKGFEIIGEETRICQADKTWSGQSPMCLLIRCPNPTQQIANGMLTHPKPVYNYNDEAYYSCEVGFEMLGNEMIKCLATKTWSSKPPTCSKILCPPPGNVLNGNLEATDEMVTYTCDAGFELMGKRQRRCLDTGEWDSGAPSCLPVYCPIPEPVNHGSIEGRDYTFGQTIRYTCDNGYMLDGSEVRECTERGEWDKTSPQCVRKACSVPRPPDHGQVLGASYLFEDIIEYRCDFGYSLVGVSKHTCQADTFWSESVPYCEMLVCNIPPQVDHATFTSSSETGEYGVGVIITYTCNQGYQMEGPSTLTCQVDTSWSAAAPRCTIVSCPPILSVEHGSVVGRRRTFESTIKIRCDKGYHVVGLNILTCRADGQWSSEVPACQLQFCQTPNSVLHGGYTMSNGDEPGTNFQYEDEISYFCNPGYSIVGNVVRQCDEEGLWSDRDPACVPLNCGRPPAVRHSRVIGNNYEFGDTIRYECNTGYKLVGSESLECGEVGAWEGRLARCEKIECGPPHVFDHASVTVEYEGLVQVAAYECNSGYTLQGDSRAVCDMGSWVVHKDLDCVPVDCGSLEAVPYTTLTKTGTTLQSTAIYSCFTGYELSSGELNRVCEESGKWSGQSPVCSKTSCGEPITDVKYTGTDFYFRGTIYFTCSEGYDLVGAAQATCRETGLWSESFPSCEKKTCGRPPADVAFTGSDFTYGGRVLYNCPLGYDIQGTAEIKCQADGTWSGETPHCYKVNCGPPPDGPHYSGSDFTYESSVTYFCPVGTNMVGEAVLTCQANRSWSIEEAPVCERVSCGVPPSTTVFTGSDFFYGGTVEYRCPEGYYMEGDSQLTCGAEGHWVGEAPSCQIVDCGRPLTDVSYNGDEFTYGSVLEFYCEYGYTLIGDRHSLCQVDGTWSTSGQICIKVNCGIPSTDALFRGSDFSYGGEIHYYCDEGFNLAGEEVIRCEADGTWSSGGQTCTPVDCGRLSVPDNAEVLAGDPVGSTIFNSVVQFGCEDGFSMTGDSTLTCLASGRWSSQPPTCTIVFSNLCDLAVDKEHTRPIPSGYRRGDSLTLECVSGYQAEGDMTSTCEPDGAWSRPPGECRRVANFCDARVELPNSGVIRPGYLVGDRATVPCETGYQPIGDLSAICLEGGQWSSPTGRCAKVYCGRPKVQDVVNVMLIGRSYFYGDHVMFMCRPGLTPVRTPPRLTCKDTGQWDGEAGCQVQCKFECQNGGRCVGLNKCKCMSGYGGIRCEIPLCILPCLNGGSCAAPYQCSCPPGYTGTRCQTAICSKPCQNGGRCLYPNRCQCPRAYLPPFCDKKRNITKNINIG